MYIWHQKEKYSLEAGTYILERLLSADGDFFIEYAGSEVRSKLESVTRLTKNYIDQLQSIVLNYFEVATAIILLLIIAPQFAWIAYGLLFCSVIIFYILRKIVRFAVVRATTSDISFGSFIQEILNKRSIIQSYDTQKMEKELYINEYEKLMEQRKTMEKIERLVGPFNTLFQIIAVSIMGVVIGNTLFSSDIMSVPAAVMFIILFLRAVTKNNEGGFILLYNLGLRSAFEKVVENILVQDTSCEGGKTTIDGLDNKIEINNLNYAYKNKKVFSNFNTTIPAHKLSLIVGPNGSGKTTLVHLLMRLRDCPPGTIFIDGNDIRKFDNASWKKNIAYVAQEITLFNGTLRENIAYGNPNLFDEEIHKVLRRVDLFNVITNHPDGLNMNIADNGMVFSGGQRQRIAIARALLRRADVVIFDEATKSVDEKTEKIIWDILLNELADTTRIVVSHNPAHKKLADVVIDLPTV
jgi:ABC-type multidrug transport system fused ATPase/permease subunit